MTLLDDAGLSINWPRAYRTPNRWTGKADPDTQAAQRVNTLTELFAQARAYHAAPAEARPTDLRLEALAGQLAPEATRKPVFLTANDVSAITSAVEWAVANRLRPIIVGGNEAPLCSDLLNAHHVPVILTDPLGFPRRTDADYNEPFTLAARLEAAGITWCFAPADVEANARNLPYDAAMAVAHGLSPDAALRAITLSPATIFGLAERIGSLELGKAATLIVTDGTPLEITTNVRLAFIDGRNIDLSNKQTELRDLYLEKYRQLDALDQHSP
jgi:hypothetical protein